MNRRIALIEDDEVISENYADFLQMAGFSVDVYRTLGSVLHGVRQHAPDLMLLDIALNGERDAGFVICTEVRRLYPTLPIIFLTSHASAIDKVSGYRLGADDYLTKDVTLDFLAIRIEAMFRRLDAYVRAGDGPPVQNQITWPIAFDALTSTVAWRAQPLRLTFAQYSMLKALVDASGQIRSAGELMRAARIVVAPNTIAAHIKAIRQAFADVDPRFDGIRTERGRGYRWAGSGPSR